MEKPIIKTSHGKVRGVTSENLEGNTFYKFLGIPYGKPPVGELRFRVRKKTILVLNIAYNCY